MIVHATTYEAYFGQTIFAIESKMCVIGAVITLLKQLPEGTTGGAWSNLVACGLV